METLVSGLYDESWRVRQAAAEQLSKLSHGERAVPRLLSALADRGQTGARNSAAEALVRLGLSAMPALISLLSHADPDQRKFAADILGGMQRRESAEPLIRALDDGDPNVRAAAAEALGRIGGEAAVRALEEKIDHPDPLLRLCALEGLGDLKSPPALERLVPLLELPRLRRTAYRLLGLIPQPAATELICRGLQSEIRSVQEAAVAALATQRSLLEPVQVEQLEAPVRAALTRSSLRNFIPHALANSDREVAAGALFLARMVRDPLLAPAIAELARDQAFAGEVTSALSTLGPGAASELLRKMDQLSSPARAAAAEALVGLVDASHVESLATLAESAEIGVQVWAIKALGRSNSAEAAAPLARLLNDDQLAPLASQALVHLARDFESALSTLTRTLRDGSQLVRASLAEASAGLRSDAAIELIKLALDDQAAAVRSAAARALGKLSPAISEPLLRRALQDLDAWVQAEAIEAAGESRAMEVVPLLEQLATSVDGLRAARAVRALATLGKLGDDLRRAAAHHRDPQVVKEALSAVAKTR
jgi:HEAT repeat protein